MTLYGVPLVASRTVSLAPIDPPASREMFIRSALVEGHWRSQHSFVRANKRLLSELSELEERTRRRDIVVDDEALFAFYDARLPDGVVSARSFDAWWKTARAKQPQLLALTRDVLLNDADGTVAPGAYPDVWRQDDVQLRVSYRFAPSDPDDGVTIHVPLPVLHRVDPRGFDWQVPGLRAELVTALIRTLPKQLRRNVIPVPDVVREVLPRLVSGREPLVQALARELVALRAVSIPPDAWDLSRVPPYLRITFRVEDGERVVARGKDLAVLQRELAPKVRVAVAAAVDDLERSGLRGWTIGSLPQRVERVRGGHTVQGFPALVDEGDSVGVRVLLSESEQRRAMRRGTRRLLLLTVPSTTRPVHDRLDTKTRLLLTRSPHGSVADLLEDCRACAIDALLHQCGGPVWDADSFARLRGDVAARLPDALVDVVNVVARILTGASDVRVRVEGAGEGLSVADARAHLDSLVYPGFVTDTGSQRLPDLVRYITAIDRRLDKVRSDAERDRTFIAQVRLVQEEYEALLRRIPDAADDDAVAEIRWMIEELRVSLHAQQLGTRYPISDTRIIKAITRLAS